MVFLTILLPFIPEKMNELCRIVRWKSTIINCTTVLLYNLRLVRDFEVSGELDLGLRCRLLLSFGRAGIEFLPLGDRPPPVPIFNTHHHPPIHPYTHVRAVETHKLPAHRPRAFICEGQCTDSLKPGSSKSCLSVHSPGATLGAALE